MESMSETVVTVDNCRSPFASATLETAPRQCWCPPCYREIALRLGNPNGSLPSTCSFFPGSILKTPIARDGDEAIPPFFLRVGTRIAFFHQLLLIKENRQRCSLRCRGTNPGQ